MGARWVKVVKDFGSHEHSNECKYEGSQIDNRHRHQIADVFSSNEPTDNVIVGRSKHFAEARARRIHCGIYQAGVCGLQQRSLKDKSWVAYTGRTS